MAGRPSKSARCSSRMRRTSSTAAGCVWTVVWSAGTVISQTASSSGRFRATPRRRRRPPASTATTASAPRRRCCDTAPTAAAAGQHHREDRRAGGQRVDARIDPQQRAVGKGARVVAEQLLLAVDERLRQVDELVQQPLRGLVRESAAAVRRADGDHAADRRIGLEEERLVQLLPRLGDRP